MEAESEYGDLIINKKHIVLAFAVIVLVVTGIAIGASARTVGATEVGLKANIWTKEVDPEIMNTGLYFLPFEGILKFPMTVQEVFFFSSTGASGTTNGPLNSRTNDGLTVNIQLAFHYRLKTEEVYNLFMTFRDQWHGPITGEARSILRDVAAEYNAVEYFFNRTMIGLDMELHLQEALSASFFSNVVFFQLREIDLPPAFEDALERVQVAQQEYEIAKYEQEAALVRAETEIYLAQAIANITIISAEAEADAFLIGIEAAAKAINITLTAESLGYYALGQALNMTATELLAYLWIKAILEHDESLLIIGSNTPSIILNTINSNNTRII